MSSALKILVTSQKGGVGKSTISVNLAAYFAYCSKKKTALLDFDHQATSGKWVKKAYPIDIDVTMVDLPNSKGSGMALLKAREAQRKAVEGNQVVITDLTWSDVLPPEFTFEFDLMLVPSSLSMVELDSTLEFINRISVAFNSTMRPAPKLIIVPSRIDDSQTYEGIFSKSFNTGFFLSPPVMYSARANDFFGREFFVMTTADEIRENFMEFARAIEQLGQVEADLKNSTKVKSLPPRAGGSILDRFRAMRKASQNPVIRPAANDSGKGLDAGGLKSVLPAFLRMGRDA